MATSTSPVDLANYIYKQRADYSEMTRRLFGLLRDAILDGQREIDDLQKLLSDKMLELKRRSLGAVELESLLREIQVKDAKITETFGKSETTKHFHAALESLPKEMGKVETMLESALSLAMSKLVEGKDEDQLLPEMKTSGE